MPPDFMTLLATNWGPMGLLVGFLIWERMQKSKDDKERRAAEIAERAEQAKERLEYEKEVLAYNIARLEADKLQAGALASLTTAILKGGEK